MPTSRLHPLLRMVLCAIGLLIVVSLVQAIGMGVLLAFSKQLGVANLPAQQRVLRVATTYGLHLTVISYPLGLAILYFFRTRVDKYSWRSLGFSRERAWPNFVRGAFTALLTLSVLFSLMWVAGVIRFAGWSTDAQTHSAAYALAALLGYGLAFGAVGFFEETVFRGYALANLRQWLGWPAAVVVQAAVFAAIHLMNGALDPAVLKAAIAGLPNLFLIAVFFAVAYRKTGSLWFPIGFHVGWNWLLGCVFSLPVSGIPTFRLFEIQNTGTSFLSGGLFGAEGSFFLIPLVLAMIYALWLVPDHPRALANLDHPESALAPTPSYEPAETSYLSSLTSKNEAEETEAEDSEARSNRYSARFGSAQGFDSDMLRELKQMQEARDQAERERLEAQRSAKRAEEMRLEEIRRAQIAAQANAAVIQEPVPATSVAEEPLTLAKAEPTVQEQAPVAAQEAIARPVSVDGENQEVAVASVAPVVPVAPQPAEEVATPEPPKPVRRSLEPRRPAPPKVPTTPPAPAPQQTTPAPTTTPTPATPPEETAPATPAPPKKARPRW